MTVMAGLSARFELERHGNGANLASMEGLRGFAVFLVFLVHFADLVRPWTGSGSIGIGVLNTLGLAGHTGVDLFFVLSGYLIYGSLISRPRPFGPYLQRRLQRIYPTFLFVFVVYLVLSLALPAQSKLPTEPLALMMFLGSNLLLLPGILPLEPLITVAWSLSYELFYYLTVPLLIGGLGLRSWSRAARCWLVGALALAIAAYCAVFTGHVRLIMFLAGILLFEAMAARRRVQLNAAMVVGALLIGLIVTVVRPSGSVGYALRTVCLFVSFFVVCYGCFVRPGSSVARSFSWTPLRWLGNMSYSYYLIHGLALKAAFMGMAWLWTPTALSPTGLVLVFVLMFTWSLVPASMLFLVIERPLSLAPGKQGRVPSASPVASR